MNLNDNPNMSIGCTVSQCKYHADNDYCTLDKIKVVNNQGATNEQSVEVTDCGSYEYKQS